MNTWEYIWYVVRDEHTRDTLDGLNHFGAKGWRFTGYIEDTGYATKFLLMRQTTGR